MRAFSDRFASFRQRAGGGSLKSLYDVLGARSDDDAQGIKKAFRTAVKAHHPDLHPGDPDAVLRFRRIVTANAILRDEKQRAAYDHQLEFERRQIKPNLNQQLFQLPHQRRQAFLKMGGAAAIVVACVLAGKYRLFMPIPTTAGIEVVRDKPATANTATIVETVKTDEVAASAAVSVAAAGTNEHVSAAVMMDTTRDDAGSAPESTGLSTAHGGAAGEAPAIPEKAQTVAQHAAADAADAPTPKPGASPAVADKGDDAAVADPVQAPPPPHGADFYLDLGTASYRIGDFPGAIVNLDQAIRLDPTDARAYNVRGNARDEIGLFENALADYDEAIRLDPKNPLFFHDRAIMWHRTGNLDKALVDLDRAIRFSFSDPEIYCDRGLVWYEKGSHARAIADFDHAVKLDPDFAAAYISRGLILHRNSEFNVAFADLGRMIRVSPSVFDATKRMALHP
jgi:tetratricopeptide (TPR) repeat protein